MKTSDDTFTTYYGSGTKGLRYSVSSSGFVTDISYLPSLQDNSLRCAGFPPTDGGITAYAPFYEFPYDSLENITSRLGEFSVQLRKHPDFKGYLIVYASRDRKISGVARFANEAKKYLVDELKTDPKAIEAINGGYREEATIELFLIPNSPTHGHRPSQRQLLLEFSDRSHKLLPLSAGYVKRLGRLIAPDL